MQGPEDAKEKSREQLPGAGQRQDRQRGLHGVGLASFWDDGMFWDWIAVEVVKHCECIKCHRVVHFKMVNFL